jgi:hypothetical protein
MKFEHHNKTLHLNEAVWCKRGRISSEPLQIPRLHQAAGALSASGTAQFSADSLVKIFYFCTRTLTTKQEKKTDTIKIMKKGIISIFCFIISLSTSGQENYEKLVDSLRYIIQDPYLGNCSDPVFNAVVCKGKAIVPELINKMTDTRKLKDMYVPITGEEYAVADVAYIAIQEIIANIPTFELLGFPPDEVCGVCSYYRYVRESKKNRKRFQKVVREWYEENKDNLIWIDNLASIVCEGFSPAGGHFVLQKNNVK